MRSKHPASVSGLTAVISIVALVPTARAQQKFVVTSDTFIDSGSPGSPDPATGQPNGGSAAIVNGQDIYSYGADGKVKAVTSNYSSSYPFVSATHILFTLPQSFWNSIGTGPVESVIVSYYPFNDSLNTSDAHDNMELHPLTRAFTTGDGTQSPLVASNDGGATWETYDGSVADAWTTPGGDYDAANFAYDTATDSTLPASKGSTPFSWDITSLINNPTTRAELEDYGALVKVTNEGVFPSNVPIPPGVNDFVSFYSADYMTAMNTSNPAFVPNVVVTLPTCVWNNTGAGSSGDGITWDTGVNFNWNSGSGVITFAGGGNVLFNDNNNGHYSVHLNSAVTPGSIAFDNTTGNYTVSGTGSIGGSGSLTKTSAGTVTLDTVNTYSGGTNVRQGSLIFAATGALPAYSNLTIGDGAEVQIANHGTGPVTVLQVGTLVNGGLIDLTNNDMVIRSGASVAAINTILEKSYNNGAWNSSTGITSSAAAADTMHLTAIGMATGLTSFEGQAVLASDVLLKYTYYGDTNLDGAVDGSDYSDVDNGFINHLTGWYNGDFNYDGVVDGSDYTLIDNSFNTQGASLGVNPAALSASVTAQIAGSATVPEPAPVTLCGIAAGGLLGRRRLSSLSKRHG